MKPDKPIYLTAATTFDAGTEAPVAGAFSSVLYSGAGVFGGEVHVDLSTLTIEPYVPVLADHDPAQVVGVFTQLTNSGKDITASGMLFIDDDPKAGSIYKKAKKGMQWQASIGVFDYSISKIDAGKVFEINGRTATGPAVILRNAYLREASIVAMGADKHTNATFFTNRASAPTTQKEGAPMPTQAEFDELKTELAAIKALLAEKDAALLAAEKATRMGEVKELFAAIGREFDEAKAAPYTGLSADSFAAIASDLKANHKAAVLPATLTNSAFSAQGVVTTTENPLIAAMRGMGITK
jgi:hypothetical protein